MKKIWMVAAALTIAVATAPSFVNQSLAASSKRAKAAPERSPYCDMAKSQRNTPSWNEHYGCLKPPARQASARSAPTTNGMAAAAERDSRSTYCGLAKNQRNTPSWNEYYHCLH
jgi:hypothetical protein